MSFDFNDYLEAINIPLAVIEYSGRILYKNKAFIKSLAKHTKRVFDAEEMFDLLNIDVLAFKSSFLSSGRYAQTSYINDVPVYYTELVKFTSNNTEYIACTVYPLATLAEGRIFLDPLTGILNRIGFEYYADKIHADNINSEFLLMIIDIDHFKRINDKYGHVFGDKILTAFASRLNELQTDNSFCGRFGGDEFTVIHRISNNNCINSIVEKHATLLNGLYNGIDISCSVGSALARGSFKLKDMLTVADNQLLKNKKKL